MWILLPALVSLAAVGAGRLWRDRAGDHTIPLTVIVVASVLVALAVYGGREEDVTTARAFQGALVAGGLGFALPSAAYYALGRFVRRPVVIGVAWFLSLALLVPGAFVVTIWTADLTQCTPDDYECPL